MTNDPREPALALLVQRLSSLSPLSAEAIETLQRLPTEVKSISRNRDFRCDEDLDDQVCLVAEGLVARVQILKDGRRQIVSLHIPGEMVDLASLMLPKPPVPLQALCQSTIISIPHDALRLAFEQHADLAIALWRRSLIEDGILAQAIIRNGRFAADAALANLLCELAFRYRGIGKATLTEFDLPMSQPRLGEMLGLTAVHLNRIIIRFRADKLATVQHRRVEVHDWRRLKRVGEFDPAYLCLSE